MIPAEFEYHAPGTLKEAAELLAKLPDAKLLAGGMSLIPAMKHRLSTPAALIDLGRVAGLDAIGERRGKVALGATTTHAAIGSAPELQALPIFAEAASQIGDVQVRNRGTFAGSLVHADPAADWPAVFLALDGEVTATGPRGERSIGAADFFTGMLATAVQRDEVVTEVRFAVERKRTGTAYTKLRQPASGFALVGAAACVTLDRKGRCDRVHLALTGLNPVPFRAASVEARLAGQPLDTAALSAACASIEEVDPMEDIHASAEYRRHIAGVFARRALARAGERAQA